MLIVLLISALVLILAIEVPRLIKEKLWKELAVFLFLWAAGSFVSLSVVLRIELPNPTDIINAIFAPGS
ncbi:MAG: hypothetical protein KGZ63_01785 [Clostridiales bacterium]|jgi:hypothetical protein|nr:hypothetical protein [Clostridiales bacterium]